MQYIQLPATPGKFVWHFIKAYKRYLVFFMIVSLVWTTELALSPYLIKLMIDGAVATAQSPQYLVAAILTPAVIYVSLSVLLNIVFRIYDYVKLKLLPTLKVEAVSACYQYLSQHSYQFFQNNFSGRLANKLSDVPHCIEPTILIPVEVFIPRALAVLFASGMLYLAHPVFSYVLFVWAVLFILMTYFMAKNAESYAVELAETVSMYTGHAADSISNIVTAKLFANEGHEQRYLRGSLDRLAKADRAMQWYMLIIYALQGIAITVLSVTMLYLLIRGRIAGWVTAGDFAFVLMLSTSITMNVWNTGQEMVRFAKEWGKFDQALDVLLEPIGIKDLPNAKPLVVTQGEIKFKSVDFKYIKERAVFNDVNLVIRPGQKIGLVGPSGGGKSTFVKLILRLFDIQSGQILIDNQPITEVTKASLSRQIGMIPQEPDLFHRTIMENIRYGRLDATDEEVFEASKKAHCHEFVENLPDGYDTYVGERGVKLSGGQKQRIAIARAILKQAPILILDEATSSLDSITEKYIQESLHDLMRHKTTLVIAHRLSTLNEMDRILFFKQGAIVEDGTLDELKQAGGYFSKLWAMQHAGYLKEVD